MSITWNLTAEIAPKINDKVVIYTTLYQGLVMSGKINYGVYEGKPFLECLGIDGNGYGLPVMPFWTPLDDFMKDVNSNWHDPAVTKPEMGQAAVLYCINGDIISAQLTIPLTEGEKSVWDTHDEKYGVVHQSGVKRWYPFSDVINF